MVMNNETSPEMVVKRWWRFKKAWFLMVELVVLVVLTLVLPCSTRWFWRCLWWNNLPETRCKARRKLGASRVACGVRQAGAKASRRSASLGGLRAWSGYYCCNKLYHHHHHFFFTNMLFFLWYSLGCFLMFAGFVCLWRVWTTIPDDILFVYVHVANHTAPQDALRFL